VNAGVLLFDAAGRITTLRVTDFPSPYFNGGTPTGALGSLVINTGGLPPPVYVAGIGYDNAGAICVLSAPAAGFAGGLPVTAIGQLCVSYDQTPVTWVAGIPLDASGLVCLATPVPPLDLSGFDSGFDGGFG
jgi:hypothetical protein